MERGCHGHGPGGLYGHAYSVSVVHTGRCLDGNDVVFMMTTEQHRCRHGNRVSVTDMPC